MITLNLDTVKFTAKPTGGAIGGIQDRVGSPKRTQTIEPDDLIEHVKQGKSFKPAVMKSAGIKGWQSQQVIVGDVDNDRVLLDADGKPVKDANGKVIKIPLENPLTPDEARAALAEYGIDPYFMYETFNSRPDWLRYRIVLILDEAVTDSETARDLSARLAGILNKTRDGCADTSVGNDPSKLIFGSRPDCVFYRSGKTTSVATLLSLPAVAAPEATPAKVDRPKVERRSTGGSLQDRLDDDIKSFDLARFMEYDGGRLVKRGKNTFINPCPICHHRDCMQVTGGLWHCFSSNHSNPIKGGTIIDYLMARDGLTTGDALEKFKFDIMQYDRGEWEADREARKTEFMKSPAGEAWLKKHRSTAAEDFQDLDAPIDYDGKIGEPGDVEAAPVTEALAEPPADFTDYLRRCIADLDADREGEASNRLMAVGLSMKTAKMCGVGYDLARDVLIVPYSKDHYVAITETGEQHEGKPAIMGLHALYDGAKYVYVTGDALAALSVIETGKDAIAIHSNKDVDRLLKLLDKRPTPATLIICIGGSEARNKAADRLKNGLRRLNVAYLDAPALAGDLNAAMIADRAAFEATVDAASVARPDNVSLYIDTVMGDDLKRREEIGIKPTGFKNLDAATHGGLRPGLYLFGAVSSLGKTTFCSQLADGLAENGADVLYFSLEQSRLEMVTKSLAREMARIDIQQAVSSGAISDNRLTAKQRALLARAVESYKAKVGDHISIIESGFNADTRYVADYVRQYVERTGIRPCVIIDYLQVLKSGEITNRRGQGTREIIEEVLGQLVLLKRDLDLTILCIVSLNRANYQQKFDFESIKESGLAEYSADVVWGLQLRVLDENDIFEQDKKGALKREAIREAKAANPRRVKLCSIKHRGQNAFYDCYFDYRPQYDLFVEAEPPKQRKEV